MTQCQLQISIYLQTLRWLTSISFLIGTYTIKLLYGILFHIFVYICKHIKTYSAFN